METENNISKTIDVTEEKAKFDASCKKLLSFKIILAHILKSCTEEFKDLTADDIANNYIDGEPKVSEVAVHQDEQIKGMKTEDKPLSERTVMYDILFYVRIPNVSEKACFIVNVEAQGEYSVGYPIAKRGEYYLARELSAERNRDFKDDDYKNINKVFSIWFCLNVPHDKENTATRFSMKKENIIGNAEFEKSEYDLMELIIVCIGDNREDENYKGIIKLIGTLISSKINSDDKKAILENEYGIKMTKTIEGEVIKMSSISSGIYNMGKVDGRAEGFEDGKIVGSINAYKDLGLTIVDAVKKIVAKFGMTEEDAEKAVRKNW